MEQTKNFYTLLVFSENIAGLLNQVTAVFTRRQVNIESLNVSASSTPGVHKYTITCWTTEEEIIKITKQIEKKIDILRANYYTDQEIFFQEAALYKLQTSMVLENPFISQDIRKHGAEIIEVNPTYTVVTKRGVTAEILSLFDALNAQGCVLQFARSGRIAVTRSRIEYLDKFLEDRQKAYEQQKQTNH